MKTNRRMAITAIAIVAMSGCVPTGSTPTTTTAKPTPKPIGAVRPILFCASDGCSGSVSTVQSRAGIARAWYQRELGTTFSLLKAQRVTSPHSSAYFRYGNSRSEAEVAEITRRILAEPGIKEWTGSTPAPAPAPAPTPAPATAPAPAPEPVTGRDSRKDQCGSGWYKDQDGALSASRTVGTSRTVGVSLTGKVRYCNRKRALYDQYSQRVFVGVPQPIVAKSTFSGSGRTKSCQTMSIRINADNIPNGSSITLGFDGKTPTGSVTTSSTNDSITKSYTICSSPPSTTTTLTNELSGFRATVPNDITVQCAHIRSVTVTVSAYQIYRSGTTEGRVNAATQNTDLAPSHGFYC